MNENLVMDCIKLCVITLIAGLLLGIVYNVTKAPIAAQEEKTKQEAYKAVFKDAAKFDTVKLDQKDVAAVLKKNDLGQNTISEVVKDGSGKNDDSKVDAISGATITSRAVTSAVNSCVAYSKSLKGGN